MRRETGFAKGVKSMDAGEQRHAYDASAKRVLAYPWVIALILIYFVPEFKGMDPKVVVRDYLIGEIKVGSEAVGRDDFAVQTVRQLNVEDATVAEGTTTFDIRCQVRVPGTDGTAKLELNIEAQNDEPSYPITKRGMFYVGRLISMQGADRVVNSHYENLEKVISIWIVVKPKAANRGGIARFYVAKEDCGRKTEHKREDYDLFELIVVYLDDKTTEYERDGMGFLEVLLSHNLTANEKIDRLQNDYDMKMTEEFESEVGDMCNLSEGVYTDGIDKGIDIGRTEGIDIGMAKLVTNYMAGKGVTVEQAMEDMLVPEADRAQIAAYIARAGA